MTLKIISYNVNGLRAAINKGFYQWLQKENPDILSLQEIKVLPDQIDLSCFTQLGYFDYWYPAEKKGYSGTALFTKIKPDFIQYGLNNPDYDREGRFIRADFGDVTHITTYFPSGTTGEVRQEFKMKFLEFFALYIQDLQKLRPNIIISGDINIAHKDIDINFPGKHQTMSGFLPEERAWVDQFLGMGFVDSFRVFNQKPEQYSWWTYRARAREKNLGWRIDYNFVTNSLLGRLKSASILSAAMHSDHCPVAINIDL
jgi:exodeoxyribonuclease-3